MKRKELKTNQNSHVLFPNLPREIFSLVNLPWPQIFGTKFFGLALSRKNFSPDKIFRQANLRRANFPSEKSSPTKFFGVSPYVRPHARTRPLAQVRTRLPAPTPTWARSSTQA